MIKINLRKALIPVIMAVMVIAVSCENKPIDKSKEEIKIVYQAGKTFHVENFETGDGRKTHEVKTGTVRENKQEVENWVSAKSETEAAMYLLMMYSQSLDYMRLCSQYLDKDKVDKALSDWKSIGGRGAIFLEDKDNNILFFGKSYDDNIVRTVGRGKVKVKTIQKTGEKNVSGSEDDGKYVITDIEFSKE